MREKKNWRKNHKGIIKKEVQMFLAQEFMHKEQLFVWILADTIKILGLCCVWAVSAKITGAVDQGYVVSYYILMLFVGKLMQDVTPENGVRQILSGKFSNSLLKPVSHLVEYLGINIGSNIFRLILSVPASIMGIVVAKHLGLWVVDFNPYLAFLALIAIVFGFFINFMLGNIFSLLAFYYKNMEGLKIFYYNVAALLSGEYVPFAAFSVPLLFFVQILPFRYTLAFPIEILLGNMTGYDIVWGFTVALIWLIALYLIYLLCFKISIKKYAAEGI